VGGLLRAPYTAMYTSFTLTLHTTLHTPPYAPKHFYEALVQTRFIRYKELFYVDLRALTMASLVLGIISYLSLYYAIFVRLRAPTGGLNTMLL
jgi:hypothetical protein